MVAGAAWLSWGSVWRDAAFAMQRSAESGAEYGARALDSYAVALGRIHDRLTALSDADVQADERVLHLELQRVLRDVPHADAALVLDRDSNALVSSAVFPVDRATRHDDGAAVVALRSAIPPGLRIGRLTNPGQAGGLGFSLSRRPGGSSDLAQAAGGFEGTVLITIRSADLAEGLRRLLVRPGDAIALVQDDGAVLAISTDPSQPIPAAPVDGPFLAAVQGRGPDLFETLRDTWVDGTALAAARPLAEFRIHALAMRPRAELVAEWGDRMVGQLAFAIPAMILLLLLSLQVRRDQHRLAFRNQGLQGDVARGVDRLRRAEEIGMIGTFEFDTRSGSNIRSAEYMSVHGMPPVETLERHEDWARRLHPDDRARAESHILAALADPQVNEYSQTYRIVTPGGEVRWIMSRGRIERDARGHATIMRGAHLDVTQLRTTELALADSDARLRLAQEAVGIGTWEWVPSTGTLTCSRKMLELWGFNPSGASPSLDQLLDALRAEDQASLRALLAETRHGIQLRIELRLHPAPAAGGETVWLGVRATLLDADPLAPARMIGVAYDITDRKRSDEMATILAHEVEHRAKNVLMIVSSLLRMTKAASAQALVEVMDRRVRALSRTMALLGQGRWRGAGLREIIESEVGHFNLAEGAAMTPITLSGPAVTIDVDSAQPLSMALHELATNAAKYGALSVTTGTLDIAWRVDVATLHLRWTERGGPILGETPPSRGFGSNLITMLIEGQLKGSVDKLWASEGLVCTITFPLSTTG